MGYGENGHATATRVQLDRAYDNYEWIYLVGDIGYADDAFLHTPFSFEYENVYNDYMNWMQNITAQKAFMVLPGNHESECHSPACLLISEYRDALKVRCAWAVVVARLHLCMPTQLWVKQLVCGLNPRPDLLLLLLLFLLLGRTSLPTTLDSTCRTKRVVPVAPACGTPSTTATFTLCPLIPRRTTRTRRRKHTATAVCFPLAVSRLVERRLRGWRRIWLR